MFACPLARFPLHRAVTDPVSVALWPLSVDGMVVLARHRGLLTARSDASSRRLRWAVQLAFFLGVLVSLVANIAAAPVLAWQPDRRRGLAADHAATRGGNSRAAAEWSLRRGCRSARECATSGRGPGWAPENLGDRLNELAGSLRLRDRVHRKSVRRWVYPEPGRPAPRVPRKPWPALVCHLLHERLGEPVTLGALGWISAGPLAYVPADDGLDQPWDVRGVVAALAEVVDAGSMERRQFLTLTGLTLTAGAHQWLFDPARVAASLLGKRVDHALVDGLERVADERRRMDDAIGGGTLLPSVREDLRLVVAILDNAAYTEEVGKRLHAVAAELGRLAGWLAYDANEPAVAQRYFLAA